jgi:hypothetical protein
VGVVGGGVWWVVGVGGMPGPGGYGERSEVVFRWHA